MTPPGSLPPMAYAGIAALVAFALFRRVRRLVGRQRLKPLRQWISLCLFPLMLLSLGGSLLFGAGAHPLRAGVELVGAAIGVGLGIFGLRHTRFEVTPQGLYYTPNAHIGIALSLLVAARLGWRLWQVYTVSHAFTEPPLQFVHSPLTVLVVGMLAGYFATHAWGLLRWARGLRLEAVAGNPA